MPSVNPIDDLEFNDFLEQGCPVFTDSEEFVDDLTLEKHTLVARLTATGDAGKLVAYEEGGEDGAGTPVGITITDVDTTGDVKNYFIYKNCYFNANKLKFVTSGDLLTKVLVDALAAKGLYCRNWVAQ